MEELIFLIPILMLRDRSSHDEVDDVHKIGSVARNGMEMLIGECVTNISPTCNVEMR